jgi:hypothetical protein
VELRRNVRVPLVIDVCFTRADSSDLLPGRSRDLSLGGMYVETYAPLAFKSQLSVHLRLPADKSVFVTPTVFVIPAVVRWTDADGMGVQFGPLGARATYAIAEAMVRRPLAPSIEAVR